MKCSFWNKTLAAKLSADLSILHNRSIWRINWCCACFRSCIFRIRRLIVANESEEQLQNCLVAQCINIFENLSLSGAGISYSRKDSRPDVLTRTQKACQLFTVRIQHCSDGAAQYWALLATAVVWKLFSSWKLLMLFLHHFFSCSKIKTFFLSRTECKYLLKMFAGDRERKVLASKEIHWLFFVGLPHKKSAGLSFQARNGKIFSPDFHHNKCVCVNGTWRQG